MLAEKAKKEKQILCSYFIFTQNVIAKTAISLWQPMSMGVCLPSISAELVDFIYLNLDAIS